MANVPNPRAIINRKELQAQIDELLEWEGATLGQQKVFALYKRAMEAGYGEIRRRFEEDDPDGRDVIHAQAYLADQLVRTVHETAVRHIYPLANPTEGERMSVVATGGYGRGELAPYSDIDLLFLLSYKVTPHGEQVVEYVLYTLWDLGLKVGHATRSVDEAIRLAKDDITICTSMLEARWITGDKQLVADFRQRFAKEVMTGRGKTFVDQKLAERDDRHARMGDTRYVLEPNIKEGKGGLRDLQTLSWIAKFLYQVDDIRDLREKGVFTRDDVRRFTKAHTFLWTVRCHLHYLAKRPEERLTFNMQAEIGSRMGYTDHAGTQGVERFMKHYYLVAKDVGDLTRVLCAVLEESQAKRPRFRMPTFGLGRNEIEGFPVDRERLKVEDEKAFANEPVRLLSLFRVAQQHDLDIHPDTLRLVRQNLKRVDAKLRNDPDANAEFMAILTGKNPETALTRLNEAGVFGRFVPDFGRVVAQMQYDMYHVYTVDEHTIRAIGILYGIETGRLVDDHPVACSVFGEVQSRRVLYVAVLLHDIAKGRGGDHSELGAKVALRLCPRFGLNEWETETVSWLVRYHLAMSNTAFKRDPDDPKTVQDFVALVQSPERLRLLLILTVADIRAVGPNVWNAWKAGLLRELYWRAAEALTGTGPEARRQQRVETAKAKLAERLAGIWTPEEIEAHLERGPDDYWLTFDVDVHARHAEMVRKAETEGRELKVETLADPGHDVTEVVVYATDHPGLFAHIAGAIALAGFNIVDAKIVTLKNGMALDTFSIQTSGGEALEEKSRLDRLEQRIGDALAGKVHPGTELRRQRKEALPSRTSVFKVPPRVLIDNKASNTYTVIEINGRDRTGLLHDLTRKLTTLGLQIGSAIVSTYGERVVDVFYVKDVFGMKVIHDDKLKAIEAELLDTIDPEGEHRAADAGDGKARAKPSRRSVRIGRRKAEPPKDPVEQQQQAQATKAGRKKPSGGRKGGKPQAAE